MKNVKIQIHNRNLDERLKGLKNWNIHEEDKKDIPKFLEDGRAGELNKGIALQDATLLKHLDLLKFCFEYFKGKKKIADLTKEDVKAMDKALNNSGKLNSTLVKTRLYFKRYLEWKHKSKAKAEELTDFFDLRLKKNTVEYLSEQEIEKLFKACKSSEERYLISVLFDSGARIEEFLNIRYEDIQFPGKENNFIKLTLKEEFSKTAGRTISLYWKNTTEAVKDYIAERMKEGIKSNEPVFKNTYDGVRFFLSRLGLKTLKKPIHCHLFRHSSATYYATRLNRQELCYRYGWKFSSDMPDVYISRAGMESKELDVKFESGKIEELKERLDKYEQLLKIALDNGKTTLENVKESLSKK